jgi:hypothetical protein
MNVEIERMSVSLHDVPVEMGHGISQHLESVIRRELSTLKLRTAGFGVGDLDLGVINAPANADAHTITELIAARLVEWISRDVTPDGSTEPAPASAPTDPTAEGGGS